MVCSKRTGLRRRMVTEMDYERGYVFDLMEQGGPTDVREHTNPKSFESWTIDEDRL